MSDLKISDAVKDVVESLYDDGWPDTVTAQREIQLAFNKELDRIAGPLVEALEEAQTRFRCHNATTTDGLLNMPTPYDQTLANYRKERGA